MDFLDRISTVFNHEKPDRVPCAFYSRLLPRGDFEREMRNKGVGIIVERCSTVLCDILSTRKGWGIRRQFFVVQNSNGRTIYNLKGWYIAGGPAHNHKLGVRKVWGLPRTLAITSTEKSEVTVPYDKLYCLHKSTYWWNNDGDIVRLLDPEKDVVMEVEIK